MFFDIPLELFLLGSLLPILFTIIALASKPRIHWLVIATGMFISIFALATDNIQFGYSETSKQISLDERIEHYNVASASGLVDNYGSAGGNTIRGEYVKAGSALIGKEIDCIIDMELRKLGSPPTSTLVYAGVWNSAIAGDRVPDIQFGTLNVTQLHAISIRDFDFCLPAGDIYTIQLNDVIGFRYSAGNATNTVRANVDDSNIFDGTLTTSRRLAFTGGAWTEDSARDHTFMLTRGTDIVTELNTIEPNLFPFTELIKTLFALIGGFICITSVFMIRNEP